MFTARYFNPRYWSSRYWAKVGGESVDIVGFHEGEVLVFSAYNGIITSANAQTGKVKVFNAVDLT